MEIPGYDILTYKTFHREGIGIECRFTAICPDGRHINEIAILPALAADPAPYVAAKLALVDLPVDLPATSDEPRVSTVTLEIESKRDRLKWRAVGYIRAVDAPSLADFLAGCRWNEAGLIESLVYEYAMAAEKAGAELSSTTAEGCWECLVQIVKRSTDEQLQVLFID